MKRAPTVKTVPSIDMGLNTTIVSYNINSATRANV